MGNRIAYVYGTHVIPNAGIISGPGGGTPRLHHVHTGCTREGRTQVPSSVYLMGSKQDRLDGEGIGRVGDDKHRNRGQTCKCKHQFCTFGDGPRGLISRGLGGA